MGHGAVTFPVSRNFAVPPTLAASTECHNLVCAFRHCFSSAHTTPIFTPSDTHEQPPRNAIDSNELPWGGKVPYPVPFEPWYAPPWPHPSPTRFSIASFCLWGNVRVDSASVGGGTLPAVPPSHGCFGLACFLFTLLLYVTGALCPRLPRRRPILAAI